MIHTKTPRCFVGWTGKSPHPPMLPAGRTPVWSAPSPLWTVGDWRPDEARAVAEGSRKAVFLGTCLATDDELRRALRTATVETMLDSFQRLPGSYAVVVQYGQDIHVLTDRAGLHPVYHTQLAEGTVFGSDALILAALRHRNLGEAVNSGTLAAGLFVPDLTESLNSNMFRGVARAGPGNVLTLFPSGHTRVTALAIRAAFADAEEACSLLRSALLTAVDRRVSAASKLSTDLSGGLDSSTLAVLSAQAGGTPVAVTYTDPYAGNDEDLHFARAIAATEPRLDHIVVTGNQTTLPFTAFNSTPMTDDPTLDAVIYARTSHRLAPALAHKSSCHLTGDGGDVVLTAPGMIYLGDLARAGSGAKLRHESTGWARLRHHSARTVRRTATTLANTSWNETLQLLTSQLTASHVPFPPRRGPAGHLAWAMLSPAASWGTLRSRQELAERLRVVGAPYPNGIRPDSADAVALRAIHWHGAATRSFTKVTRSLGITVQAPYFDGQVVDACLAATAASRTTVDHAKPLLAAAVGDRMPPTLIARRTKGDYTACEYHGLRTNARQLNALLDNSMLADLDVINPDQARGALGRSLAGAAAPLGALSAVVAAEAWLHNLDTLDPAGWWEPRIQEEGTR
ncbi:albusnodin/ikarugamycin family macrolactam cyclase [Phytoactinopolyspora mesophila]|uniref:asparagine synthase (glutamine-hydrolyzing) n=1 Tax=Phytoactinopolyspora mesophila TaxID=2650750 RepID=A0A7K3MB76_9ACTN|nr:albusnodin/ikarugamycin family macrolactam cyclase [Phytoactinopolyspora mesophila]NDL60222.1 albusnodin/ikarugamycin family macrolactam cyclase [Phytoactinopolyspora mesophila]